MSRKGAEFSSGVKEEKVFLTKNNIDEIEITPENEEELHTIAHKNWAIQGLSQEENPSQVIKAGIRYDEISLTVPEQKVRNDIIQDVAWGRVSDDSLRKAIDYVAKFNDECKGDPEAGYDVLKHGLLELEDEVQDIYTQEVLDLLREATRKKGFAESGNKRESNPQKQERANLSSANTRILGKNAIKGVLSKASLDHEKDKNLSEAESKTFILEQIGLRKIDRKERKKILKNISIEGDDNFFKGGLNRRIIERSGLAPEYEMNLEGTDIKLSKIFDLKNGRVAAFGYIEDEDQHYKVMPYYRSNSHGTWRLLPDYDVKTGHFGKGWNGISEDSLNLPIELQYALNGLSEDGPVLGRSEGRSNAFFSATKDGEGMHGELPYYQEVSQSPFYSYGALWEPRPAKSLSITGKEAPNFDDKYISYTANLPLYGKTQVDCYYSHDKERKYVFYKDKDGRAAIANIETNAPITSTGLRSEWIELGRFGTPIYEYGYQGEVAKVIDSSSVRHPKYKRYYETFSSYLSKAPIIQDYLAASQEK